MSKKWQILLAGLWVACLANAAENKVIHRQNNLITSSIKYPVIPDQSMVNIIIKSFIDQQQQQYSVMTQIPATAKLPKTNQLDITYKITREQKNSKLLSLIFYINGYYRGAAHPNNTVQTFNFLQQKKLGLASIFKNDVNYLNVLSKYCYPILAKKFNKDLKWVATGTKPIERNYQQWYVTDKGLVIVFQPYQVAAYFEGLQQIKVPKKTLKKWVKPSLYNAVWPV